MIKNINLIGIIKKAIISFIVVAISFMPIIYSNADFDFSQLMSNAKDFVSTGESASPDGFGGYEGFQKASTSVGNVLMVIGMGVAVVIASILGIQFMLGSAEQKADIKGKAIPFVIGCLVVFCAFGIWKAVVAILNSATK